MKLKSVHIKEFKSVWDSNPFEVGKVTCLVGKNEAGKTAVLQALYRLNPIIEKDGSFDVTDDYPRSEVDDYQEDVAAKQREQANIVTATFSLDTTELAIIHELYGEGALQRPEIVLSRGYAKNPAGGSELAVNVPVAEASVVEFLVKKYELPDPIKAEASKKISLVQLVAYLTETGQKQDQAFNSAQGEANQIQDESERTTALEKSKAIAESEQAKALRLRLAKPEEQKDLGHHIWETILLQHLPKFLYFDEYYQMTGHENIEELKQRQASGNLNPPDYPLLGLIQLARLDLDKLISLDRTQGLKNKLEGAESHLSKQILKYWSQNRHLRMKFDVRNALAGDPVGMRNGHNIWGEVLDSKHHVSTGLGTRSRGFVWFFSFLAWYAAEKKKKNALILLLDEPGLSLHGKAQEDLLRYFESEIVPNPNHQLIYTTHSPFMVDPQHFERVRIVQDKSIDTDEPLSRAEEGTKVFTDVLEAGPDTLFPLQGALGYEIYQTLFIGPNSVVVEGSSDLLYIQTMTGLLQSVGRVGLDSRWTITPVGGAEKVPTFVALIGSQKNMNVATLVDIQKKDRQLIENLYKRKLLKKSHVLTFADFTKTDEADIEDMFDETLYLDLLNSEFAKSLQKNVGPTDIAGRSPRILVRLNDFFSMNPMKGGGGFNHYRPARFFAEHASSLKISDETLDRFEAAFKALNALLK